MLEHRSFDFDSVEKFYLSNKVFPFPDKFEINFNFLVFYKIRSITVNNLELVDTLYKREMSSVSAGTSHRTVSQNNVVQYEANGDNHDTTRKNDYEEDNDWGHEELYEEEYWEQSEPVKKGRGLKTIHPSECCNAMHDNFITYRKTCSKDQKERQLNKGYKLDITTTLLIEKLVDVRNFGPYHDAIGEGRNSIVIGAGPLVLHHMRDNSLDCQLAIKIYKLSDDAAKNKAIFERTRREVDHMDENRNSHLTRDIPCPVLYCKNVIIMDRVGTDEKPALSITMVPQDLCSDMYDMIVCRIKSIYGRYGSLVHGNLNAKSILYWDRKPFFVGFSHSVYVDHPNALKKLMKDCYFVTKFFKRRGVPVKSTEDLFKEITKLQNISREVLDVIDKRKHGRDPERSPSSLQGLGGSSRFK